MDLRELFDHLHEEHNLLLVESEEREIQLIIDRSINSHRSDETKAVRQNEHQKEDFFPPFLLCTKFPFCKTQCDECKAHEPKEKSD